MKYLITNLWLIILITSAYSQSSPPNLPHITVIGESNTDEGANSLIKIEDDFIIGGYTSNNLLLVSVDTEGNINWQEEIEITSGSDNLRSMIAFGNKVIGCGFSVVGSNVNGFVFMYDPATNSVEWEYEATSLVSGADKIYFLDVVQNGNTIDVYGQSKKYNHTDALKFTLDDKGQLISGSTITYDYGSKSEGFFHTKNLSGFQYSGGRMHIGSGGGYSRAFVSKINPTTNIPVWTRTYFANSENNRSYLRDLEIINDDRIVIIGEGNPFDKQYGYIGIIDLNDPNGNTIVQKEFHLPSISGTNLRFKEVIPFSGGFYVLADADLISSTDHLIIELDDNLNFVKASNYDGTSSIESFQSPSSNMMILDDLEEFIYFIGESDMSQTSRDIIFYKIDASDFYFSNNCSGSTLLNSNTIAKGANYSFSMSNFSWNSSNFTAEINSSALDTRVCNCFLSGDAFPTDFKISKGDLGQNEEFIDKDKLHFGIQEIIVYPNPARDQINIEINSSLINTSIKSIELYSEIGMKLNIDFSNVKSVAKVENIKLQNGIYFLKVIDSNQEVFMKKIMIHN